MAHVNNKFERKNEDGSSFPRTRNFLPSEQKARGKFLGPRIALQNACQKYFNQAVFALAFFSQRRDRELPGAISRGLLDCPR
jgi:hypothetical protein